MHSATLTSLRNEIFTHNLELYEIANGSMASGNNFFLHYHALWPEGRRTELVYAKENPMEALN